MLEQGDKVFDRGRISKREERLQREDYRLKKLVGELTIELKERLVRRRPSMKREQNNTEIVTRIRARKAEHQFWGYRRIWART